MQPAPPSAECSCDHQDRSALTRREDTFAAVPCDPTEKNGLRKRSSSSFQCNVLPAMVGPSKSRPPMSHRKTDLGIPRPSKSAKVVLALLHPKSLPTRSIKPIKVLPN